MDPLLETPIQPLHTYLDPVMLTVVQASKGMASGGGVTLEISSPHPQTDALPLE